MNAKEKAQLLSDVAVIKEKVSHIADNVNELKPKVEKNTRFRLMVTGFVLIGVPLVSALAKILE